MLKVGVILNTIMEAIVIEDNLDKECHALGGLFQHIIGEMKVSFYRPILFRSRANVICKQIAEIS